MPSQTWALSETSVIHISVWALTGDTYEVEFTKGKRSYIQTQNSLENFSSCHLNSQSKTGSNLWSNLLMKWLRFQVSLAPKSGFCFPKNHTLEINKTKINVSLLLLAVCVCSTEFFFLKLAKFLGCRLVLCLSENIVK